jgi:hypothetical protein
MSMSFSQFENTCASGPGGPGLKRGDESAGRSMLGTETISSMLCPFGSVLLRSYREPRPINYRLIQAYQPDRTADPIPIYPASRLGNPSNPPSTDAPGVSSF